MILVMIILKESNQIRTSCLTCRYVELLIKKIDKDNIFNFLEVGCNLGYNLRALKKIENFNLYAAEPNKIARDKIISDGILMRDNIIETSAQNLTFSTSSMDINFNLWGFNPHWR